MAIQQAIETPDKMEEQAIKEQFTKHDFNVDNEGYVSVYTDSYTNHKVSISGLGVWFSANNEYNCSAPARLPTSTIGAKVQATTLAFKQAAKAGLSKVSLHTDCVFVIQCFVNKWFTKWGRNNWTKSNGEPVKNEEDLKRLVQSYKSFDRVKWVYVQGKNLSERGIMEADALARKGALRCTPYTKPPLPGNEQTDPVLNNNNVM